MAVSARPLEAAVLGALGLTALLLGALAGVGPLYAIAAALGVAFVLIALSDLAVGVAIFVGVTFMDILPVGASPLVSMVKLAGAVLALAWIARIATGSRAHDGLMANHRALALTMVLFAAWALVSAIWAENSSDALIATERYALNFLILPIVFTAVGSRRDVLWVLGAFLAGAVLSATVAVISPPAATEDLARIEAAGLNSNDLATVLVAGLVIAIGLVSYARRSPIWQLIAVAAATLCGWALMLTLSRSGLVALAFALIASLLVASRSRGRAAALAAVLALLTVGYFAFIASPEARDRVTSFESDEGTGRVDVWTVGWRMVEDKPATGVGVGNFADRSADYLLQPGALQRSDLIIDTPKVAHNIYLESLAELGIPGLVLLLGIIFLSVRETLRAARRFREDDHMRLEALSRALFAAQVGFLAAALFASIQFNKQLWVVLALGPALSWLAADLRRRAAPPASELSA